MAQIYPLDKIIRKVEKGMKPFSGTEKVVIIDRRTGESKSKASFFDDVLYFLVSNSSIVNYSGSVIHIEDGNGRRIDICPSYRISCAKGSEEKVARALYRGQHPAAVFDQIIESWIIDAVGRNPADFIDSYFTIRVSLKTKIIDKARAELGLELDEVKLPLSGEETLKAQHVELRNISIRTIDYYDEEQVLDFTGDLRIDERYKINAIAKYNQRYKWEDWLIEEIKEFFLIRVELEQLYQNLELIKESLKRYLNERLNATGWQFGPVFLRRTALEEIQPFIERNINVILDVPEYPAQITISNSIQMVRKDAAKFKANKPSDIDEWLTKQVNQAVKSVFFGKKYADLLLEKEQLEEMVKAELNRQAESIGYGIRHLITIPRVDEITWLDEISFEINQEFITSGNSKVKLEVSVRAKLNNLQDVAAYLNRHEPVPPAMKDTCITAITQFLHEIDSQQFHVYFDFPKRDSDKAVKAKIIELIKDKLRQDFHAETIYVDPRMGQSNLTDRDALLREQWHDFATTITSKQDLKTVVLTGKFIVNGIIPDAWDTYESRNFTIEDVKRYIQDTIKTSLNTASSENLIFTNKDSKDELEKILNETCAKAIREAFGLSISIRHVDRESTDMESILSEKLAQLKRLIIEAVARGDDEADIDELQRRINALEAHHSQMRQLTAPTTSAPPRQITDASEGSR